MTGSLGLMGTGPMFGASQSLKIERTTTSDIYKEGYSWTTVNNDDSTKTDTNIMGENNDGIYIYTYYAPPYGFVRTYPNGSTDDYANSGTVALRVNSIDYGTGNFTGSYTEYAIPTNDYGLTSNSYKYFNTSVSALGSVSTPVYVSGRGKLSTCNSFVPTSGGDFTGPVYFGGSIVKEAEPGYYAYMDFARTSSPGQASVTDGYTWASGTNYAYLGWAGFALGGVETDGTNIKRYATYWAARAYSINATTGAKLSYYYTFRFPDVPTGLTANATRYIASSSSTTRGGSNQPVYLSSGYLYTCNTFVPNTGGTFTGDISISGTYYPSFTLSPTTANSSTSKYPLGVFEGSYDDNVSMWIWGDKTDSTKSRRGLVLYNYSVKSDAKQALALRQCDTSGNWQSDLYILHSGNYTDYLGSGGSGDYVPLAGGTMTGKLQVNNLIFGYNYGTNGNNVAAFVWDKPGSNYTGMGACGESDTIYFGACDAAGTWNTSYRQNWKFNGSLIVGGGDDACNIVPWTNNYSTIGTESLKWWKIYSTYVYGSTVYGAVWNDYAEYRSQNEELIAGYIAYCDDDGKLKYTTERLQKFEGVVSDTFGFAIGETDDCKTPLAVSGRALVYCDPEDHFHSGDCVCAGPDGKAYRMTREEIAMYPDRIVGVVSEIPTYERWGTGDVEVNGRIWIKVK